MMTRKTTGNEAWDEPLAYLTRSQVARLLGVSPNTVTRWAREGRLPCQVTLGGHHRFERALIEEIKEALHRGGVWPHDLALVGREGSK